MDWNTFWLVLVFLTGLGAGSFLNAVIYRIDDLMSIVKERSECPHCKKAIAWYDLFPLLSFVALRGFCRHCRKKISWQYPIVEFLVAILFVFLYLHFGIGWYLLIMLAISMALVVIFVVDLQKMIVPDIVLYPALILWAIVWIASLLPSLDIGLKLNFSYYLYGGLIGAGFIGAIVAITRGRGMGVGDIKLAGLLGFILGWPYVVIGLLSAFIIGSLVGIVLLVTKKKGMKSEIPFAPFLIIGFYIALFFGERVLMWYLG